MAIYKVKCEVFIEADTPNEATSEVFDVINHAIKNYDGWASGAVDMAELYAEDE